MSTDLIARFLRALQEADREEREEAAARRGNGAEAQIAKVTDAIAQALYQRHRWKSIAKALHKAGVTTFELSPRTVQTYYNRTLVAQGKSKGKLVPGKRKGIDPRRGKRPTEELVFERPQAAAQGTHNAAPGMADEKAADAPSIGERMLALRKGSATAQEVKKPKVELKQEEVLNAFVDIDIT